MKIEGMMFSLTDSGVYRRIQAFDKKMKKQKSAI
jgi:hypothetical protein